MDPTLGELARTIAEVRTDTRECRELMRDLQRSMDATYLRQDVAEEQHRTIDVQMQAFEEELHSLHKRVEANQTELVTRIAQHDRAHDEENESRAGYRRQFTIALTAAIVSPLVGAVLTILLVLTLGVRH